jgi:perosamine synthetase
MCTTDDEELAARMRLLRSHGSEPHGQIYYYHPMIGHNFRMTSLQAALGVAQLARLSSLLEVRRAHEELYRRRLAGLPGVEFSPLPAGATPVPWMHCLRMTGPAVSRDQLAADLASRGVETRPFFYPLHLMPPYQPFRSGQYPVAEELGTTGLNLPSSSLLLDEEIDYVCGSIVDVLRRLPV